MPRAAPYVAGSATSNVKRRGPVLLDISTGPVWRNRRCEEHTLTYIAANRGKFGDRFQTPVEYVGYELHDPLGKRIGSVQELFLNDHAEPEYIRVKMGLFKTVLIPVQTVAADEERRALVLQ